MAQASPILVLLLATVLLGYLVGGRLGRFAGLNLNWWGVALGGLALQTLPVPGSLPDGTPRPGTLMLLASYVLLLTFLAANRRVPGARLMAAGVFLNLVVVIANGGMPVSADAIERASGSLNTTPTVEATKHHLMTEQDTLTVLGDVIPLPPPIGVVLSIGDVLLYLGVAWCVIRVMRGWSLANPRPLAMWFLSYRGKHAPVHWRMPARYRAPAPAAAGRSGT
jgi:hypothetical protein